jgi:hypothetical protein
MTKANVVLFRMEIATAAEEGERDFARRCAVLGMTHVAQSRRVSRALWQRALWAAL